MNKNIYRDELKFHGCWTNGVDPPTSNRAKRSAAVEKAGERASTKCAARPEASKVKSPLLSSQGDTE